jgi:type I site-specific restriction-modification system R (restriction) subunit
VADCIHFYYRNKMQVYLKVKTPANRKNEKPTPQLQWSPFMEEEAATKVNETIDVDKFKDYIAELEGESTNDRIKAQAAEAEVKKVTKQSKEMIEELQKELAAMKLRVGDK